MITIIEGLAETGPTEALAALAALDRAIVERLAALNEFAALRAIELKLLLGGDRDALEWGMESDVVGFQAGTGFGVDESGRQYVKIADDHRCILNLEAGLKLILSDWKTLGPTEKIGAVVSYARCVPYLLLRVVGWLRAFGDKTPEEVLSGKGDDIDQEDLVEFLLGVDDPTQQPALLHDQAFDLIGAIAGELRPAMERTVAAVDRLVAQPK